MNTQRNTLFSLQNYANECIGLYCYNTYLQISQEYKALLIKELDGRFVVYSDEEKLFIGKTPVNVLN